jgi:hypothetical protein
VLAGAAFLVTSVGLATNWHMRLVPTVFMLSLVVWALLGAARTPKKPGKTAHKVTADAHGLSIDGALYMPRDAIESVYVEELPSDDGRHAVHLTGRFMRRGCAIYVESEETGKALVAALQRDSGVAAAHFRALPPWAKHLRWLAVVLTASPWIIFNFLRLIPAWGLGVLALLYGVILLPTFLPQRVDVGHDGIFLRWLGNKRFIPFSAIDIASSSKLGVDLFLRGDAHVEIRLTQKEGAADAQVKALLARIKEGIVAHAGLARADEEAFLARTGRDVPTWMREMRALGAGEMGGYRAAAIPRERLWAVVENPAADPSAREGAALALSASLDADDRARLAALAQKTAQPRLRIALDGVSREQDEARLRIALETAETETESELEEPRSDESPSAKAQRRAR